METIKGKLDPIRVLLHYGIPIKAKRPSPELAKMPDMRGDLGLTNHTLIANDEGNYLSTMGVLIKLGSQGDVLIVVGERVFRVDNFPWLPPGQPTSGCRPEHWNTRWFQVVNLRCSELTKKASDAVLAMLEVKPSGQ